MLDRDKIKKQLEGIHPQLCVAFVTRAVMRLIPLLSANENLTDSFEYWEKEKRSEYLLSILIAQRASFFESVFGKKITMRYFLDAADDASDLAASAAYADVDAVGAAVDACFTAYAAYTASDAGTDAAADAAAAVAVAVAADATIKEFFVSDYANAINADLNTINSLQGSLLLSSPFKNQVNSQVISNFNTLPLWPQGKIPITLQSIWYRFLNDIASLNEGFEVWINWFQERLVGKPLDFAILEKQFEIPEEITAQGPRAVNAYLATLELKKVDLKPLNLVRAIFIGNGQAGKTSLIRALHNESVVAGKEDMTPGIEIREWPVGETGIVARFWDFGGQVMSHSTHQFFLRERCLYILVLDARAEFNANDQAEYWLEHIKAFGKNAPVLLVGNKSDLTAVNLDIRALREKFPNIVDFYPVSCLNKKPALKSRFDAFKADLISQLQEIGTHQIVFTKQQFTVLEEVRKRSPKNAFLEHQEFDDLCKEHSVGEGKGLSQEDFLGLLDKLGEVIHFPQLSRLTSYVLNPRWLTYGVYTLLYSEEVEQPIRGELSESQVFEILGAKKVEDDQGNVLDYPKDKCGFIIDAMEEFKLCYRLPEDKKSFVIPDKLPSEQPEFDFNKDQDGTLAFEFSFSGFLPRHIMPNLIVVRHHEIKDGIVWQNGVILDSPNHKTTSRLQVDYHKRVLNIWVQGEGKKEMLSILNDEVLKILNRMDLEFKELVILPESARLDSRVHLKNRDKAPYRQLLANARDGQRTYIAESEIKYDLAKVLGMYLTEEAQAQQQTNINNFYAPVHGAGENNMGDTFNNNGDFRGANNNIKSTLSNVQQMAGYFPSGEDSDKQELEKLVAELSEELQQLAKDRAEDAEAISQLTAVLVEKAKQPSPNKTLLNISAQGLVGAANTVIGIAPGIAKTVKLIVERIEKLTR